MDKVLISLLDADRHQRHDFLNHLQVIWGYIKLKKDDKALEYIQDVTTYLQALRELNKILPPTLAADISAKVLGLGLSKNFEIRVPHFWDFEEKNISIVRSFFNDIWEKLIIKVVNEGFFVKIILEECKVIFETSDSQFKEKINLKNTCEKNGFTFTEVDKKIIVSLNF
ncbi:MAG: Spo0B domain-containing protein [Bacillota bacterium]